MKNNLLKCSICKSSKCTKIISEIREGHYDVYKCSNCDVEFINEYKAIDYSKHYQTKMFKKNSSNKEKINKRLYSLINTHNYLKNLINKEKINHVLEIGPGMGMTSNFIKENFNEIKISAYEIDRRNDKFLNSIKFQNIYRDFKTIKKKDKFDLIFCIHLIEHITDPHEFLKNIKSILKKNGFLFLITPNTNNIYFQTLPDTHKSIFKKFFYHIAHPFYHSINSLSFLLDKYLTKSEIFSVQEYSLKNYFNWYLKGSPSKDILDGTFIDEELEELDSFFKKKIDKKNYGSDIFCLYKKK